MSIFKENDETYMNSLLTRARIEDEYFYVYHINGKDRDFDRCKMEFVIGEGIPFATHKLEYPYPDLCETNTEFKNFVLNKPQRFNLNSLSEYTRNNNLDTVVVDSKMYMYVSKLNRLVLISESYSNNSAFKYKKFYEKRFYAKNEVIFKDGYYYKALNDTELEPKANSIDWKITTQFDAFLIKCYDPTIAGGLINQSFLVWNNGGIVNESNDTINYVNGGIVNESNDTINIINGGIVNESNDTIINIINGGIVNDGSSIEEDSDGGLIQTISTNDTYSGGLIQAISTNDTYSGGLISI